MVKYFKTLPLKARNLGWFLWLEIKRFVNTMNSVV